MKNLWKEKNGIYDVLPGSSISDTITEAIELSAASCLTIKFEFNEVEVSVCMDSDPELIYRDWHRSLNGYIGKCVGPYPKPVLSDEDRANDAAIESVKEEARQKRNAEYAALAKTHLDNVEAKLVNAPGIELADESGWQTFVTVNKDGYGGAVVSYSERWARLMQIEMANGKKLEDVAQATSSEADIEGITGFMYGCAVSVLSQCWKHGEQLRRWHNIDTQIGNEGEEANESGGVLNPAVLSIR